MSGVNGQNPEKRASGLPVITACKIMIAEIVPQTGGVRRNFQCALVERFCLFVFLLRIQNKAEQPQQVRPVRLGRDSPAQSLFRLVELSMLKRGSGRSVNVAPFGLWRRSDAARV